jgi:phospholipid/cholesterol/gamma-HCH transport system substrate-binding protein
METKVNYSLVGAFTLVLGLALIATILWLASGGLWHKQFDTYLAVEEESVTGLNVNAPVRYNGVEVGKVRRIALDPQDPQRVNLYLAIEQGTPIREGTVAMLRAQGLTGIAYMELSGGVRDAPLLHALPGAPYPVIATKSSLSARLEDVLTQVLGKLDTTSNNVNAILSEKNQQAFSKTLDNLARSSTQLGPVLEHVGNDTLPQLDRLLAELQVLSGSLRRLSEQVEHAPPSLLLPHTPARPGPGETPR